MTDNFDIKLFYIINNDLKYRTFKIEKNTSIKNFLSLFNIHEIVDIKHFDIGVFGKVKNLDYIIKPNDRLEIYAKIIADPKIRRKKIAKSDL
jgi:putative ubiquitin-RnfH superfamily antitoxin RatB of RatAB toxin-antitoxin module